MMEDRDFKRKISSEEQLVLRQRRVGRQKGSSRANPWGMELAGIFNGSSY